ncbi:1-aminocyclopropane-1-carboxylate oxidase homolog 1-like [Cornus florida]|uniref:1-aminocyclopropane-1-carboxylate oxidase homolog 1-like n=1 Tax=Cornus florida TaxID=4283 RepID=UPI0028972787|nr:1-aminocyclopropane-1-carboxylate oxidase homolog 1-like [Cornus florida]
MDYDRAKELKAFDETKAGVKGLVDAGMMNIPKIFIRPPDELAHESNCVKSHLQVPVIDLSGIEKHDRRREIVDEIRIASEEWGFFQVVNHGIPVSVLDEMMNGVRAFHEQPFEVKEEFYSRDTTKRVRWDSNYDLYLSRAANWRDTFSISLMLSEYIDPDEVPVPCRDSIFEYIKDASKLGDTLFELLSEALGLKPDHLTKDMECSKGRSIVCHYYPACPEPDLTLGATKHSDPSILSIVLQDQIGGPQVLHDNQWADVQPIAGGLVINIGDLLEVITNAKFKSVEHRVLANRIGPRISVAVFFTGVTVPAKVYGPINELISEENPQVYGECTVTEFLTNFYNKPQSKPLYDKSGLARIKPIPQE